MTQLHSTEMRSTSYERSSKQSRSDCRNNKSPVRSLAVFTSINIGSLIHNQPHSLCLKLERRFLMCLRQRIFCSRTASLNAKSWFQFLSWYCDNHLGPVSKSCKGCCVIWQGNRNVLDSSKDHGQNKHYWSNTNIPENLYTTVYISKQLQYNQNNLKSKVQVHFAQKGSSSGSDCPKTSWLNTHALCHQYARWVCTHTHTRTHMCTQAHTSTHLYPWALLRDLFWWWLMTEAVWA